MPAFKTELARSLELTRLRVERFVSHTMRPSLCDSEHERSEVRVVGREDYVPLVLRVTHIFRRENGDWKIIHRHGDAVVEQAETPPVRQG